MMEPSAYPPPTATGIPQHPPPPTNSSLTSANPSYAAAFVVQTHPPYEEMIIEAIEALNEKNGSSRQAIAKYIERTYTSLPASHSGLLTQHLKRMKSAGQLVMDKYSYMLAGSEISYSVNSFVPAAAAPVGSVTTQDTSMSITEFENNGNLFGQDPDLNGPGQEVVTVVKRGRGRPPKVRLDSNENGTVKKNVGGPRKPVSQTMSLRKRRGRPRKGAASAVYALHSRRPGRPPKVEGAGRKYMKDYGKPVGRPKINGESTIGPVEPKWVVDYMHARAKLQCFQTRMQQAIGALEPHLYNESLNDLRLATALQDLDQLSTIDIMAATMSAGRDQEPHQPAEKMNSDSQVSPKPANPNQQHYYNQVDAHPL